MIIDIMIPARTPKMDYLDHPECAAAKVAELIQQGKSASEIARTLGVSRFKVGKVLEFLEMVPNPLSINYLNHPKCKAEVAMQLRTAGSTFEEIGERLGVSHEMVRKVLRAFSKAQGIPIPAARPRRCRRGK